MSHIWHFNFIIYSEIQTYPINIYRLPNDGWMRLLSQDHGLNWCSTRNARDFTAKCFGTGFKIQFNLSVRWQFNFNRHIITTHSVTMSMLLTYNVNANGSNLSTILSDKTIDDNLMYIPIDDKQKTSPENGNYCLKTNRNSQQKKLRQAIE